MKEEKLPMSTVEMLVSQLESLSSTAPLTPISPGPSRKAYHRIKEVRRQQGCSTRRAAQMLKCDANQVRFEEDEATDLPLSRLLEWQKVLDVPLSELLVEGEETLSPPVMERARMVRLMKTALAIEERSGNPQMKRLALTLVDQLKEIMPELDGVTAWNSVGQRRPQQFRGRVYPDIGRSFDWYDR